jgi:RNA polymerase sigma factor (sigma-70 family)
MAEAPKLFDGLSDEDLGAICAVRPVNEEAWKALYERFYRFVYQHARYKLAAQSHEVDDLVQEAFLKIFKVLPGYNPAQSKLRTYVSNVLSNLVIDHLRHGSELRSRSLSLESEITILQVQARQDPGILRLASERIVDRLQDKSKVALIRDVLDGKDVKDICQKHGAWVREQLREISSKHPSY